MVSEIVFQCAECGKTISIKGKTKDGKACECGGRLIPKTNIPPLNKNGCSQ